MKGTMLAKMLVLGLVLVVCRAELSQAAPMGTAFTYQGRLIDANNAADGIYDFAFKIYDANVAGTQKGSTINIGEVDIIDGYFTVQLDFGSDVFNGDARWLEIGVRPGDLEDPNVYTTLSPRQEVTPNPYALHTYGLSVVATNTFVGKDAGANNTTGNYNTFSGNKAGYSNTTGSYNAFSGFNAGNSNTTGNSNTFSGEEAGYSNTTGSGNTFSGTYAGISNTTGYANTFSGFGAGYFNTTGIANTFSGYLAGYSNTTGGDNTFSGYYAGYSNTTGYSNTFSGYQAGIYNTTGHYNTFSGLKAGYYNTTGSSNVFSGDGAGFNNTTGSSNSFFGSGAGVSNGAGTDNTYLGYQAGYYNTTGNYNTFSGYQAGYANTTGSSNTFSGYGAGNLNTTGGNNTFSGNLAGASNTTGNYNTFSGMQAGYSNTTGGWNTFSGNYAGYSNTTGTSNTFSGMQAGYSNTTGNYNTFSGNYAGYSNTTGNYNVFIGYAAGYSETGSNKLYIANSSGTPLIYGDFSTSRVGIHITDPTESLDVQGTARLRGIGSSSGTTVVADGNGKLWKQSSSKRYKTNIATLDADTDAVLKLRPVRFQWRTTGQNDIGLIAEEVEQQLNDLVIYDNEGRPDAVKYDRLALYLLSIVKVQQEKIKALEAAQAENRSLSQRIEALEQMIRQQKVTAKEIQR